MRLIFTTLLAVAGSTFIMPNAHAFRTIQMDSGGDTTCAVVENGHVACWGSNRYRTLGVGINDPSYPIPLLVVDAMGQPLRTLVQVSVSPGDASASGIDSGGHACAVSEQGEVWCWGRYDNGRLGVADVNDHRSFADRVRYDDGTIMNGVAQVATGGAHSCALLRTGRVHCWGADKLPNGTQGLLGQGGRTEMPDHLQHPSRNGFVIDDSSEGPLEGIAQIAAGRAHTCARGNDGLVRCWGHNNRGQIGNGTQGTDQSTSSAHTVRTSTQAILLDITRLASGSDHNCAIKADEQILCWGANHWGQSGYRDTAGSMPSVSPFARTVRGPGGSGLLSRVKAVALGSDHTCVRTGEGNWLGSSVQCWGYNSHGQIGDEVALGDWSVRPVTVTQTPYASGSGQLVTEIRALSAGHRHSCILHNSRRDVRCWGRNQNGQRGLNYTTPSTAGFPVPYADMTVTDMDGIRLDEIFADGIELPPVL